MLFKTIKRILYGIIFFFLLFYYLVNSGFLTIEIYVDLRDIDSKIVSIVDQFKLTRN